MNTPGGFTVPGRGTLERDGYTLWGWRCLASGGNEWQTGTWLRWYSVTSGTNYYDPVWRRNQTNPPGNPTTGTVTVRYFSTGHTGNLPGQHTVTTPGDVLLRHPPANFQRAGHVFGGWRCLERGTIVQAGHGFIYTSAITETRDFDAVWNPVGAVTITYHGNNHTHGQTPGEQTLRTPGSIATRDRGSMSRAGYVFDGWRLGGVANAPNPLTWTEPFTGTVTLEARWANATLAQFNGRFTRHTWAGTTIPFGLGVSIPDDWRAPPWSLHAKTGTQLTHG